LQESKILLWNWHGKPYIGAVHGVVGIVYMMLRAIQIIG
jgi:hypothetical protein